MPRCAAGSRLLPRKLAEVGARSPVAVSVETIRPEQLVALVLDAYGLSARGREVVDLVLLGHSTGEIMAELFLSPYTVQDHLRVSSTGPACAAAGALAAELLFRHYPR